MQNVVALGVLPTQFLNSRPHDRTLRSSTLDDIEGLSLHDSVHQIEASIFSGIWFGIVASRSLHNELINQLARARPSGHQNAHAMVIATPLLLAACGEGARAATLSEWAELKFDARAIAQEDYLASHCSIEASAVEAKFCAVVSRFSLSQGQRLALVALFDTLKKSRPLSTTTRLPKKDVHSL